MHLRKMWRGIYIGLWISLLCGSSALSQTLEQTQLFAQKALANGDYATALPALQRLVFFNTDKPKAELNYQIAQCYKAQGNFALAERYFDNCFYTAEDSLAEQAVLGKIGLLIRQRQFNNALSEVYSLGLSIEVKDVKRLAFFEAVALFGAQRFDKAELAFINALPNSDSLKIAQIHTLFSDKRLHTPRPKLARNLSFFLPGLGQTYAGDIKNGVNSLALNALMLSLASNVALNYSVLDALLAVIPWFQRYYLGGTQKAEIIAQNKLLQNQGEVYLEVLTLFTASASD